MRDQVNAVAQPAQDRQQRDQRRARAVQRDGTQAAHCGQQSNPTRLDGRRTTAAVREPRATRPPPCPMQRSAMMPVWFNDGAVSHSVGPISRAAWVTTSNPRGLSASVSSMVGIRKRNGDSKAVRFGGNIEKIHFGSAHGCVGGFQREGEFTQRWRGRRTDGRRLAWAERPIGGCTPPAACR